MPAVHRIAFIFVSMIAALSSFACTSDSGDDGADVGETSSGSASSTTNAMTASASTTTTTTSADTGDVDSGSTDTGSSGPPAIVLAERVFLPDGRVYYVSVLDVVPSAPVDRTKAREFTSADLEVF